MHLISALNLQTNILHNSIFRLWVAVLLCFFVSPVAIAQAIPVSMQYTEVYDFIDELITDGVISHQTSVRPYTRL